MPRLFRQFSTPGGMPEPRRASRRPGSIHEGGELGYALVHAFGAVFDNPDLLVACVVGDGEAETAPLEGSWKSIRFLNAARDGAVLPILHLNEYKISGPDGARVGPSDDDIRSLLAGHGYDPVFVEGDDPAVVHHDARRGARRVRRRASTRSRPTRGPRRGQRRRHPALARARVAHPEGLDRSDGRRRHPGRGHVPVAPGAGQPGAHQPRAPRHPRVVAAQLPARRAVRRRRPPRARRARAHSRRPAAHGRQPERQRRTAARRRSSCPTQHPLAVPVEAPATELRESTRSSRRGAAVRLRAQRATKRTSGCSARTRPTRTGSARCSTSRTGAGRSDASTATITSPPTVG